MYNITCVFFGTHTHARFSGSYFPARFLPEQKKKQKARLTYYCFCRWPGRTRKTDDARKKRTRNESFVRVRTDIILQKNSTTYIHTCFIFGCMPCFSSLLLAVFEPFFSKTKQKKQKPAGRTRKNKIHEKKKTESITHEWSRTYVFSTYIFFDSFSSKKKSNKASSLVGLEEKLLMLNENKAKSYIILQQ